MLPHVFALLLPLMAGGAAAANGNNNTNVAGPNGVMDSTLSSHAMRHMRLRSTFPSS